MPLQHAHELPVVDPDERVLKFPEWCELNGFSQDTGRRIIARGEVEVVDLSLRRFGITVGADRRWKAARTRKGPRT